MSVNQAPADFPRIPVLLITGFLGSGKTTLVNRLLRMPAFERAAVVVNEYGEVSVDHRLVDVPWRRMRVVDSGCLCGHVHEEVASSLLDLHDRRASEPDARFDLALVETSGLADPVPIMQILLTDPAVSAKYELRSVITVADGVHGSRHLEEHLESVKQAAVADTLLISKTDIADTGVLDDLAARLAAINPGARQLGAAHGEVDAGAVLEGGSFCLSQRSAEARRWLNDKSYAATTPPRAADPSISTFALEYDGEITLPGLVLWMNLLAGFRGAGLLRVKGIVNVEGLPYAIQAVQTVISEPAPLAGWQDGDDRRSRLVFITRGMDVDEIRRTFAAFSFNAGRARRNLEIRPENYARFRETMELFRGTTARAIRHR